jgi:RimJ/RimL family protein N-acetyltransferase
MQIEKVVLEGPAVRLEPLSLHHMEGMAAAILDGELWKLAVTLVPPPTELDAFFAAAEAAFATQQELAFAVVDRASSTITGSTRFRNINPAHRRVEIGFTFFGKSWQRSHVNTAAKYLMLKHAFEHWQCNRVEFVTDVLNTASRNAIVRIGGQEEGVLRSHMVMRNDRIRDSVIYSIVREDWPAARHKLEQKTARQV